MTKTSNKLKTTLIIVASVILTLAILLAAFCVAKIHSYGGVA